MNGIPISVSHTVKDFHHKTHHQTAVAKRTATMISRGFRNQYCRIINFKSQVRPHNQYFSIIFTHMPRVDQIAIKNVRWALTKNIL